MGPPRLLRPGIPEGSALESLRRAAPGDLAALEPLVAQAYARWVQRLRRAPAPMLDDLAAFIAAGQVHLLEEDGGLRGLVVLVPEPDAMLLHNIAVAPDQQGRGLGRRLLEHAERVAHAAGHGTLRLYTNAAMTENIALYERAGYLETGRHSENGLHRVDIAKPLG